NCPNCGPNQLSWHSKLINESRGLSVRSRFQIFPSLCPGETDFPGYARRNRGPHAAAPYAYLVAGFISPRKSNDRLRAGLVGAVRPASARRDRAHPRASRSRVGLKKWRALPCARAAKDVAHIET